MGSFDFVLFDRILLVPAPDPIHRMCRLPRFQDALVEALQRSNGTPEPPEIRWQALSDKQDDLWKVGLDLLRKTNCSILHLVKRLTNVAPQGLECRHLCVAQRLGYTCNIVVIWIG